MLCSCKLLRTLLPYSYRLLSFSPVLKSISASSDAQAKFKTRKTALLTQKEARNVSRKKWLATLSAGLSESQLSLHHADALCFQAERDEMPVTEGHSDLEYETEDIVGPDLHERDVVSTNVVLGIDPDVQGAMAVLRGVDATTAEVFDVPNVQVMIGETQRKRHNTRLMVDLIHNLNIPYGSVAYIEQAIVLPKDGKKASWATGYGFGVWIGVLVASGLSVIPVTPSVWKRAMFPSGKSLTKDECRESACSLFPSLAPQLRRKKDHGRAEALLIAAYGKGIQVPAKDLEL